MALVATTTVDRDGASVALAGMHQAAAGDTFMAGPSVFLLCSNASGGDINVTVTPPAGGGALGLTLGAPATVNVPASTGLVILGPYPAYPFANSAGAAAITYSATTTGMKVAVLDCSG